MTETGVSFTFEQSLTNVTLNSIVALCVEPVGVAISCIVLCEPAIVLSVELINKLPVKLLNKNTVVSYEDEPFLKSV